MSRSEEFQPGVGEAEQEMSLPRQVIIKLTTLLEAEECLRWLATPQADREGSPIDLIERGQAERLLHRLIRLEEGIHV